MHQHRNASNRLTFAFDDIPKGRYSGITRELMQAFGLEPASKKTKGLDVVFQDFGQDANVVALEWDNWSGFIVCAGSRESEPLARQIAEYIQTL